MYWKIKNGLENSLLRKTVKVANNSDPGRALRISQHCVASLYRSGSDRRHHKRIPCGAKSINYLVQLIPYKKKSVIDRFKYAPLLGLHTLREPTLKWGSTVYIQIFLDTLGRPTKVLPGLTVNFYRSERYFRLIAMPWEEF